MVQTVIAAIYGAALGPPSKSTLFITLRQLDDELSRCGFEHFSKRSAFTLMFMPRSVAK